MARASTRQTFEKGQTVWIHAYQNFWRKAQVVDPDFERKALTYSTKTRMNHYVKIIYFDSKGEKLAGAVGNVNNARNKIIDQAAYDLILRGREIARLQGDVRQSEAWEKTHAAFLEQANHIIALVDLLKPAGVRAEKVAMHLRGTFLLRDKRGRSTVAGLKKTRRELAHKATEARGKMQALDVKEWS